MQKYLDFYLFSLFFSLLAVKIPPPGICFVSASDTSMRYPELLRPVAQMGLRLVFLIIAPVLETKYQFFFLIVYVQLHVVFILALSLNIHTNGCRVSVPGALCPCALLQTVCCSGFFLI